MARVPEFGRVKTRLAHDIGAAGAFALYSAFLRDIGRRFSEARANLVWAYTPDDGDAAAFFGDRAALVPQGEGTLDLRMARVFDRLLRPTGRFDRVVMIGADVPHVPDDWVGAALDGADDSDLVLGPAEDGGYYLVGMSARHDVFRGIPMGTPHVFAATRARAAALRLSVKEVPPLFDLDRGADVRRLPAFVAMHPDVQLTETLACLRRGEESSWRSC